ncbi:MAG TPA: GNAT family N-acetyltransferase [Chitinophagaceae bacterium]|nr:GNAT family N-acetyltransferase [Chitinophagaceae bacterium]
MAIPFSAIQDISEDMPRKELDDLLQESGLAATGGEGIATRYYGIYGPGRLLAAAGLEIHAPAGLLRSLITRPGYRGQGLAARLEGHVTEQAASLGLTSIYLLTQTARDYFLARGYTPVSREEAAPLIGRSAQFTRLCPATAALLHKTLTTP